MFISSSNRLLYLATINLAFHVSHTVSGNGTRLTVDLTENLEAVMVAERVSLILPEGRRCNTLKSTGTSLIQVSGDS